MPEPARLDELTLASFEKHVDQIFRLQLDGGPIELTLREAVAAGSARPGQRAGFSLVFAGPGEPLLPQAIYRLEHGEMGLLDLFLVPIAQDDGGTRYEAVFS